jgi:hypothetical protein
MVKRQNPESPESVLGWSCSPGVSYTDQTSNFNVNSDGKYVSAIVHREPVGTVRTVLPGPCAWRHERGGIVDLFVLLRNFSPLLEIFVIAGTLGGAHTRLR